MSQNSTYQKKYTIEQFMNSEIIMNNSISYDDEKVLFSSNQTGIFNAFSIDVLTANKTQLTNSVDNAVSTISYFPNDDRFLFMSDRGGNEIYHLFVQDEEGNVKELTTGEKERALFYGWSQDGKSFLYGSNKRNPSYMDVYEMTIDTYSSSMLFQNDEGYEFCTISPNKNFIAFRKVVNANKSNMYLLDRSNGDLKNLSQIGDDIQFVPQMFSKDSNELFYLTDENSEFTYVKKFTISTGQSETVIKEEWNIVSAFFSPNFTYLVYKINKDASQVVGIITLENGEPVLIRDLDQNGQITSIEISKSEKIISMLVNHSNSPTNLYVYNLETDKLLKLTNTLNPEINEDDLVKAEVVRYKSFDGLEIPAIYYKPQTNEGEKVPALVYVHGGPGGQSKTNFNPIYQFLVNQGYAIFAVNNRGSAGYGKTFFKAADLKHGEIDLADCVEAKRYLTEQDCIDSERIGIMGGSYGGYMVLAALAFQPDVFKVGVDIFGVSNWERTLKSIPAWWESIREALYKKIGDPYKQANYIRSISPLFHADKINKPLIVLQGANDPRVLKVESDEIVEALKNNNIPVEYVVFPDEGHDFSKTENKIIGYKQVIQFLNKYL